MDLLSRIRRRHTSRLPVVDLFPNIDAVVYINLAHRTDRRAQIEAELRKCFPPHKIHRFDAIRMRPGWFGCTRSHIEVARLAEAAGWNTIMVVEDDLMWTPAFQEGLAKMASFPSPDVVLLCGSAPVYDPETYRAKYAATTTGYIVRRGYLPTLRANFEEGLALLEAHPDRTDDYCVDRYWNRLMEKDAWYILVPGIATQRPSFSDLAGHVADHRHLIP